MSKKLAVFFPGFGYGCDRPLLHYARKMASDSGCDILTIEYGNLETDKGNLSHSVGSCLNPAFRKAKSQLEHALTYGYDELYFVSKSFGTVVAGMLANEVKGGPIHQFYLTPLAETITYIKQFPGRVESGTRDPYVSADIRAEIAKIPGVELVVRERANHSLEISGDVLYSVDLLKQITERYVDFFYE